MLQQERKNQNRIHWVDMAKGIGMLLVIIGHSTWNSYFRGAIFSFHMPLFFLLSGVSSSEFSDAKIYLRKTWANFKYLFLIYTILFWSRYTIERLITGTFQFDRAILSFLMGSGIAVETDTTYIDPVGIVWFLVVLFFGRLIYGALTLFVRNNYIRYLSAILLAALGIFIGNRQFLPFSFDIALVVVLFILVGHTLRDSVLNKWNPFYLFFGSLILWAGTLLLCFVIKHQYLELASRNYPLPIISLACAIFGSVALISFCKIFEQTRILQCLEGIGKKSILLYGVHHMDYFWSALFSFDNEIIKIIIRIAVDLAIFYLLDFLITRYKNHQAASRLHS